MNGIVLLIIIALVFFVFSVRFRQRTNASTQRTRPGDGRYTTPTQFPYARRDLFTKNELRLYRLLLLTFNDAAIHGKVRLEDVVKVMPGLSGSDRQKFRGYIRPRHLDFVLSDPETGRIHCAIELDDSSHATARARHSDAIKDGALNAAGIPLVRISRSDVSSEHLVQLISRHLPPSYPRLSEMSGSEQVEEPEQREPVEVAVGRSSR